MPARSRHPRICGASVLALLMVSTVAGQGIRERTRPDAARDTTVSEAQALDLTLTLTEVSVRTLQTWVRTSGSLDPTENLLTAYVSDSEADYVQIGQRVRAFPPESKFSMTQARVSGLVTEAGRVRVEADVGSVRQGASRHYVMEILADRGQFLSIPNEAIIEEGATQIAYVQTRPGSFAPRVIQTGLQGELYTEVLGGLEEGEEVVTFGSFFIDAEYKLRSGFNAFIDADDDN